MSKKSYNIIKNCIVCPECKFGCISNKKILINCCLLELCKCGNLGLTANAMYGRYGYDIFLSNHISNDNYYSGLYIDILEDKDTELYFISLSRIQNNYSKLKENYIIFNELLSLKCKSNFYIKSKDINNFIKQFQIVIDDIFKIKENLLFL